MDEMRDRYTQAESGLDMAFAFGYDADIFPGVQADAMEAAIMSGTALPPLVWNVTIKETTTDTWRRAVNCDQS